MKRYNCDNIFKDEIIIKTAILNVCKNKSKKKNRHKYQQAQRILRHLSQYIIKIQSIVEDYENYIPSESHEFRILDKGSHKIRSIASVPIFPDQIIHEIIIIAFKKTIMSRLYHHSYASLPSKGIHKARTHVRKILRRYPKDTKYIAKLDIAKCYPSIDHSILKEKINRIYKGSILKSFIFKIVDSYGVDGVGIPIGYSTSQWLCNILLTDIDNHILHKLHPKHYVRYMDDMILLHSNRRELHKMVQNIHELLNDMNFTMKSNYQVFRFQYTDKRGRVRGRFLDFLGFKFYRNRVALRRHIFLKLRRTLTRTPQNYITVRWAHLIIAMISWETWSDVSIKELKYLKQKAKEVISNADRKHNQASIRYYGF